MSNSSTLHLLDDSFESQLICSLYLDICHRDEDMQNLESKIVSGSILRHNFQAPTITNARVAAKLNGHDLDLLDSIHTTTTSTSTSTSNDLKNDQHQMYNNVDYSQTHFTDAIDKPTYSNTSKETKEVPTKKKPWDEVHNNPSISSIVSVSEMQELELGTSFSQLVLSNYRKTFLKETELKGMRKTLNKGFAGLACIHCINSYKEMNGGRFFPSNIKTLSDSRKGLQAFSGHLHKCWYVSQELKQKLKELQLTHEDERKNMKYGNQKAFFSLIWMRLHGDMEDTS